MMAIEKNRNYVLDITGMTHEGQGVGRIEALAVFVEGALEGEQVEVRITKLKSTYAVGKLVTVLRSSDHRVEAFCSVYSRCGGCSLQHMDYSAQLDFKTKLVRDNLVRLGGLKDVVVNNAIGMRQPFNYRNKAQYPLAMRDGNVITGFYAARSHAVISSEKCGIQDIQSDKVRGIVRQFIADKGITVCDETSGKGLVRHVATRIGFNTREVMVVLVINGSMLPAVEELVKRLITAVPETKSIFLNSNTENTNVILGKINTCVYGSDTITDTIGKYKFQISPHSFFQINPVQTEVLYSKALEYAALTGAETVFDLYCGIGTVSLFLSAKAGKVYGVEVVEEAIADARKNAELNGADNVEFIAGEAEKVVPELYKQGICADVVVLDPPRKGCDETLLRLLSEMQPKRIVYISCNPATLARDLKFLDGQGYRVVEVQPVDMFPWTRHVECIVLITRSESRM